MVLLYAMGVIAGFMALAHFVFHSAEAVKALALTAIGSLVPLVPTVLARTEYRITGSGIDKRPVRGGADAPFKEVFPWEELSHLVSKKTGFKFYKKLDEPSPLRRFWKMHVQEGHSGEFHVQDRDRPGLEAILAQRGVSILTRGKVAKRPGAPEGPGPSVSGRRGR